MDLYDSISGGSMGNVYDGAGASDKERASTIHAAPGSALGDFLEGTGVAVTNYTGLPLASIFVLGAIGLYLLKKYGD